MTTIKDIFAGGPCDEAVTVCGWLRTRRDSKSGVSFLILYDGSCFDSIQVVASDQLLNYESEIKRLTAGCALAVRGRPVASPGKQALEIQAESVEVIGGVEDAQSYPIQPKAHTPEFLRSVAHLRPRTNLIAAATRIRHGISQAIHQFFSDQGFYWIHTPIITASDCEGAGDLFRVTTLDLANVPKDADDRVDYGYDFFSNEAFLGVSGQLYLEAYCLALSKVYSFGPTFRAENSNTARHLAEFWMVEPEVAFADLCDNAQLAEDLLHAVCKKVLSDYPQDLAFFDQRVQAGLIQRLQSLAEQRFLRIDYSDAIDVLKKSHKQFEFAVDWGVDLQTEHERFLAEEYAAAPVIVMNYPKEIKSFYMRINDDERTVAAMDVLVPGMGEIIGGSQREERYDVLCWRMDELSLSRKDYAWYLDLRRYGSVPHAGFGLGLERLVSYMTGLANVRDVIAFPRTPGHVDF